VNHPDTNGMIEYFIRPMSGIRPQISRADIVAFAKLEGMRFRSENGARTARFSPSVVG